VPVDALTASGSGLDPQISPEYADLQVPRVARERGMTEDAVRALVAEATTGPGLGFLGQAGVDVLDLNLALDRIG
jgi:K+-transporting ATPase ATPase C chain